MFVVMLHHVQRDNITFRLDWFMLDGFTKGPLRLVILRWRDNSLYGEEIFPQIKAQFERARESGLTT